MHCVVIVLHRDTKPRALPVGGGPRGPGMAGSSRRARLYSRAMSDEANLDELAHRYLELWQDQMSALAADPEFAEALSRLFNAMGLTGAPGGDDGGRDTGGAPGAAAAAWSAWPAMLAGMAAAMKEPADDGATDETLGTAGNTSGKTTARSPATAAASRPGGARLAKLESRLAALEDRVAALEGAPRRSRRRTPAKSRQDRL